ncbi:MAG: hypothetical protein R3B70_44960 [Polyangiaceae bacterium]
MAPPAPHVLWFGPVNGFQVKGATAHGATPTFLTCTGDGSDGQPTCADRAEAWRDAAGRRLPGLFKRAKLAEAEVHRLYLGAFSAGGQAIKRIALHPEDRARVHAILLADATYTIEWLDAKRTTTRPIEGFLKFALDCIEDGRLFLATASATPNKLYPSGAQSLDGLRRGIESAAGRPFADASADPLWEGLRPPRSALRLRNVILADFGAAYTHGQHATLLAPILWPRAIASSESPT